MSVRALSLRIACTSLFVSVMSGCYQPPFNNFQPTQQKSKQTAVGAIAGAGVGAGIGGAAGNPAAGAIIGGLTGAALVAAHNNEPSIIKELYKQDIQLITYGDTLTLIVPTDRYFIFNSPKLNDLCYPGLNNIVRLLKRYPCTPIYVAGFTDNVGSKQRTQKLSQAQAETMLTFLWAHDVPAKRLHAEGYGRKHAIGDNHLIRGSAYNRRLEIQWFKAPTEASCQPPKLIDMIK